MTGSDDGRRESPLVFISAAEPSADRIGALLIRAVREIDPAIRFVGVAGPRMAAEGCDRVMDMTRHASMLAGAIRSIGKGISMLRLSDQCLRRFPFQAAVLIDSPTLHLPLAGKAKSAGVPVMYYVAPQLWAWGANRIHKLRDRVDRLAVILPFEERYFLERGVKTKFVGHPLADESILDAVDANDVDRIRRGAEYTIALLPGSRRHVVEEVFPGQLDVAERISLEIPSTAFHVSIASANLRPLVEGLTGRCRAKVTMHSGSLAAIIEAADLVLVASGTTTLEVAFRRRPMIVMYNASRLLYHLIGRWMIRTPFLSLPNILAGKEIVPEFMPYYSSTLPIAKLAVRLLRSPELRNGIVRQLDEVIEPMRRSPASPRAANLLLNMIGRFPPEH